MGALSASIIAQVGDRCQQAVTDLNAELTECLDREASVAPVESPDPGAALAHAVGPGLVLMLANQSEAALLLIPQQGDILPVGFRSPANNDLRAPWQQLAETWARLLFPAECGFQRFAAIAVDDIALALQQCQAPLDVPSVALKIRSVGRECEVLVVGPVPAADQIRPSQVDDTPTEANAWKLPEYDGLEDGLRHLPPYSRSILRTKVPVTVILASSRQPVKRIREMGYGTLIQFEKSCEDTLTLEAGNQIIAEGEAVKVGEKFGLRVTAIEMPRERFVPIEEVSRQPRR